MEHSNPRTKIREGIEQALGGIAKVWHYRMMPFNMDEIPAINVLPETNAEVETNMRNLFRDTETFRVELAIARESDEERFADRVDALYLQVKTALLGMKTCLMCPKVTVLRRVWAVDDRGQVPLVVIRFFVQVDFDTDRD